MNEADVSRKIRESLEALGAKVYKVSDRFHASRPDLIVWRKAHSVVIEVKMHPKDPTDLQQHELLDFAEQEVPSYVVTFHNKNKTLHAYDITSGASSVHKTYKELALWLLRSSYSSINKTPSTLQERRPSLDCSLSVDSARP